MKVAVTMAAYNAAAFIEDALASLLQQRDAALLDIIVVNDGSTDETGDVVRRVADGAPEVRLIEVQNGGVTRARNILLDALAPDTDFVTSLDADDLSPAGRLARDLVFFADDPTLDLVFGTVQVFRETTPDRMSPEGQTMEVRSVQLGAGLYRYGLIQRTGRFDESFRQAEDMDYLLRMFEQQPRYKVLDDISYFYRRHESNMTKDTPTLRRDFARALLFAAKRKKTLGLGDFPQGVFDVKNFERGIDW